MFEEYPLAYCMNVHPAHDLDQLLHNIEVHAGRVKQKLAESGQTGPLGIGLWIPADVARTLQQPAQLKRLRAAVESNQLVPFTFNGFPYGNFHQEVVKHDVYLPTWADADRLEYTIQLVEIMHQLLPPGMSGSISTLPLGWPDPNRDEEAFLDRCNDQLHTLASHLDNFKSNTGRSIAVCIEPEPGCQLGTAYDVIQFFEQRVFEGIGPNWKQEFLKVCHDVCHSAVMFEDQAGVIQDYHTVGIDVGKVQISSAPIADFRALKGDSNQVGIVAGQLAQLNEPRYLHQTTIKTDEIVFFEDLPQALADRQPEPESEWRVHFHVPIFLAELGELQTSQSDIFQAWTALQQHSNVQHFEIETYAWNVLPQREQFPDLESGIAEELAWFHEHVAG